MRSSITLAVLVNCFAVLWEPPAALAEPAFCESMECVLGNSDRVVGGKVTKVVKVTGPDKKTYQVVTVTVSRTFKGSNDKQVSFVVPEYLSTDDYATQWLEEKIPLVFCLVKNNHKRVPFPAKKYEWVLREDGNHASAVLLGKSKHYWTGCIPVLTCDFEVLAKSDEILRFVDKVTKAMPKGRIALFHRVSVPGGTAVAKRYPGGFVFMDMPVDKRLEELGRKWCKSRSAWYREQGAAILGYFKNDKNVRILKSLLRDLSTSEETKHETIKGKTELQLVYRKKVYGVRQAAYSSLRKLGLTVPKPLLEEVLEGSDKPNEVPGKRSRD